MSTSLKCNIRPIFIDDYTTTKQEEPHFLGHRQRLRDRFMKSRNALPDYELLEMVLFAAIPRKDVKELAKNLLKEFGDLSNIINADIDKLMTIKGVTQNVYVNFLLIKEILLRVMKSNVIGQNVINSWPSLVEYLRISQGNFKTEQFRILFLNTKNILISDELQETGTVNQTPAYPREIIKRALFHEASAIILVHNHPSGVPNPSNADITLTQDIERACRALSIKLHDHIIVSKNDIYSFREHGLI
ncbi:MAG UNVERIFIED_CONTAM: DNA repair protein RadC [Rickettsiaceae bacterium]|jgi:DNA repair protein RadC